jgi:hypothetical protein
MGDKQIRMQDQRIPLRKDNIGKNADKLTYL